MHRVIEFNKYKIKNQGRAKVKNDFEIKFFEDINNSVYGKTMKNVKEHRDIKLVTTDRKRSLLGTEPNYHTMKWFLENLLAIEINKTEVKMNKRIYLGLSIQQESCDNHVDKKAKGTEKRLIKRDIKFQYYKEYLKIATKVQE